MAEQDDSDKTEEPTLKRLEDARKEGQVARSREFGGAAILGLSVLTLYVGGSQFAGGSAQWLRMRCSSVARTFSAHNRWYARRH